MTPARRTPVAAAAVFVFLLVAGCSGSSPSQTASGPQASAQPSASAAAPGTPPRVRLERIATLDQPLAMAVRPDDPALYVAEKTGRVVAIRNGSVDPAPVLDIHDEVSNASEEGLLGIDFSPDGKFLYASYTDTETNTRIVSYAMVDGRADPSTRRQVLFVKQPFTNHNGGDIVFGPDGYLYVGLGDGGSEEDPQNNGQTLSTLLGKMLRIDPRTVGPKPYVIPPDNPFVSDPDVRPEIWAYGLRNPWRFSFDQYTGDLWIGDVGQDRYEEVDLQYGRVGGGQNYGWKVMEGTHRFSEGSTKGMVPPVYEYSHAQGCTVVGGYVYRGRAIPALFGDYVFGDYCSGRLQEIRMQRTSLGQHAFLGPTVRNLSSFGQDAAGELYAMSLDGGVYELVPAAAPVSPASSASGEGALPAPTHRLHRRPRW